MPQKGSSRHHPRGRSPTPSTGTDSEDNSKKVSKHKQKRKSSSHQKRKRASQSQNTNAEKNTRIPNSHDLEAVDTSEIKDVQFFLKTFKLAINTFEYGLRPLTKYRDTHQLVAVVFCAFKSLRAGYKAQISNPLVLRDRYESNESKKEKELRLRPKLAVKSKRNDGSIIHTNCKTTRIKTNSDHLCTFSSSRFSERS
ncbi:hypothetical protein DFH28DRAFT_1083927 [Melampsora americana]|nr:hypothetical protein DFH28DRAFT_1083927 [Melampsora americana]